MKKGFVLTLAFLVCVFLFRIALAQETAPPLGLPTVDEDLESVSVTVQAATTTTVASTRTAVATTQEAIDDADVGSEVIALVILSLVGGTGIFFIKKYFDCNRYKI